MESGHPWQGVRLQGVVFVCVHVCISVLSHVRKCVEVLNQHWLSFSIAFHPGFETGCPFEPTPQLSYTNWLHWPVSSKDLPVSASAVPGL